jgi:hypothetical protein
VSWTEPQINFPEPLPGKFFTPKPPTEDEMIRSKKFMSMILIAAILTLAALNSVWGASEAQTVPVKKTRTPTPLTVPSKTSKPVSPSKTPSSGNPTTIPASPTPSATTASNSIDQTGTFTLSKELSQGFSFVDEQGADIQITYSGLSAGALFNQDGWCNSGYILTGLIPNDQNLPQSKQITFYRPLLQTLLMIKAKAIQEPTCGQYASLLKMIGNDQYFQATNTLYRPYFDLTGHERFLYDNMKGQVLIYWYNEGAQTWDACTNLSLDTNQGPYGRLPCETAKIGLFALGAPNTSK